jgi:hypothetical protein
MNIFTSFFVLLLLLYKNMPSNAEHIPRIGKKQSSEMIDFVRTKHFPFYSRCLLLFKYGNDSYINIFMYNSCSYLFSRRWTNAKIFKKCLFYRLVFIGNKIFLFRFFSNRLLDSIVWSHIQMPINNMQLTD